MSKPAKPGGALPPVASRAVNETSHHGIQRLDPYNWLRADNWQDVMRDPSVLAEDIRAYLEAENDYAGKALADTENLQATLFAEMKGRIKEDDSTVPAPDGPFAYFVAFETGGQHPLFCRMGRDGGARQVLADGNKLGQGKPYYNLGAGHHSPDHKKFAYGYDDKGSEYYAVQLIDAQSGGSLGPPIEDTTGGGVWSACSTTLFYTRLDDNHRPSRIYRHRVKTDLSDDKLVYEEPDQGFFSGIGKTQSSDYLVISTHDHQTGELYLIDAHRPEADPRLIHAREPGVEISVEHRDDELFFLTNRDGAEDFKIARSPIDKTSPEHWRDLVPHKPGRLILSFTVYKDYMVRLEREDGLPRIVIHHFADGAEHDIAFEEEAYSLRLSPGLEFDTPWIRFTYSSMTTPDQTYDYNVETRERVLRKTLEVPSGHDPDDYVTRRVMAPAHDGEQVPVSLLYKKGIPLDGSAPLLLYGYGAYGMSMPASFSTNRLSLVDRGVVYAIAHIRGGMDKGYRWYRTGRGKDKVNTFKDFVAAGEFLAAEGFTARGRIAAHGGSAGGMLMGAVANMAPDLFAAILAEVPFVDVLTTMLDDTLPLTPPEWPEWGNPIADAEAYQTIASYAPYEQVKPQAYPAILAMAGLTDPRVTYWEPAKWIARLRATRTDDNLTVLKTNMDAGHGGAAGRFDRLKEVALVYAFALKVWNLAD
jgi:oligopeptidase B